MTDSCEAGTPKIAALIAAHQGKATSLLDLLDYTNALANTALEVESELSAATSRADGLEERVRELEPYEEELALEIRLYAECQIALKAAEARALAALGQLAAVREGLLSCMTGGNHLGLHKTEQWPVPDADSEHALRILCATQEYDMWCCWRAIMLARDAYESSESAAKSFEERVRAEERERCAKVCDDQYAKIHEDNKFMRRAAEMIAAAIRALP